MSKIINKFAINSVRKKYIFKALLGAFAIMFLVIISGYTVYKEQYLFTILAVILTAFLGKKTHRELIVLNAGAKGEKKSLEILKELPMDCSIISDITLHFKNRTAQIDHIIISSTGIWILEVKNISGVLSGSPLDRLLTQTKTNTVEVKTPYNPIFQVNKHKEILEEILISNYINCKVFSGVYFSNKNLINKMEWGRENVFFTGDEKKLLNRLASTPNGKQIDKKQIIKIIKKAKKA